jgi:hypothetical protein
MRPEPKMACSEALILEKHGHVETGTLEYKLVKIAYLPSPN